MPRLSMEPVHLPEDDEEFHDAPEAAHPAHPATNGDQHATQHSDDELDAFHDAIEDASHTDHGANTSHSPAQPTQATAWSQPIQGHSRDVHQSSVSATTIVEEPFDSDADADGFVSSSDHRDTAADVHAPDSFPADDQFRPYADQQPVAGRVADDEEAEAEALTPEEAQERLEKAEALKKEGNDLYGQGDAEAAAAKYGEAAEAAPPGAKEVAVYFANRAACQLKLRQWGPAASDCTRALEVDPAYLKALLRRCTAYEELDDLEKALTDAKKVSELDPGNAAMAGKVRRLEPIVAERREKMKDEMMGKLKELGNTVLGKFGMSLDNFKAEKDPNTGSYSIQFKQNE